MGYDGSLKFDTKIDESGFNSGIKKVGSIATKGLAVLGTAVSGLGAAFVATNKSALESVASLEQNIGGVETLFKESADEVIKNAKLAYKTAQISANGYMSTVTSFSASLLQGLGGDTAKAAEIANIAIIDMADNANKMGTSMESIQNAYQGFAKQNYTMLDNLKLGYGGTQKEMVRLINNSGILENKIEDLDNVTFDQMIMAIHKIQENLDITGTSAKEAATTIEGAINSTKAAWDNFLNGSGTVDELVESVTVASEVIFKNIGEIAPRLLQTIPAAAKGIAEGLSSAFKNQGIADIGLQLVKDITIGIIEQTPNAIDAAVGICKSIIGEFSGAGPELASAGCELFQYFLDGISQISEQAPMLTEQAAAIVSTFMSGIEEAVPQLLTAGVELLGALVTGIGKQLPTLVPQALQMIVTIADAIVSNLPTIISAGISLLAGLIQGIINSLPLLIAEGPRIINDFADAIYSGVFELITTGAKLLWSLIQGIWSNAPLLFQNAGEIFMMFINIFSLSNLFNLGKNLITKLIEGIKQLGPNAVKAGGSIVSNLLSGIKSMATHPVTTLKNIATNAMNAFKGLNWKEVGSNIVNGIITGLKNAAKKLANVAKEVAGSALTAVKKTLGIHSPSTVFRDEVGKNMALGIGVGFERNVPTDQMEGSLSKSVDQMRRRTYDITANPSVTTTKVKDEHEIIYPEDKGIDWDEWENRQRKLNDERDRRPIFLGTDRIDKKLPKGAVPAW